MLGAVVDTLNTVTKKKKHLKWNIKVDSIDKET